MRNALLAGIGLLAATACNAALGASTPIQPSGAQAQRNYEVTGFERVSLAGPYQVIVTVGGAPSVSASGDSALLEHTEIVVENGQLRIKLRDGHSWSGNPTATVRVTAPSLTEAGVAGSGDMRVGAFQAERFAGSVAGSGNLTLEGLQAQEARFDIAGSGELTATGTARDTSLSIAGSGDARLAALQSETARISIAGSGNAEVRAAATANVDIAGSGNVNVTGGARCEVNKIGSGDVSCG
jgi:hypothetical protein